MTDPTHDPKTAPPPIQPGRAGLPTLPGDQRTVVTNLQADQAPLHVSDHSAVTLVQPRPMPGSEDLTGKVWGDFALEGLLGRGGMGAVYRARQLSLDRPVAVKVLPPHLGADENFRTRFALEAKAVAQLNSPHVIQVYAAGQHDGHHYFAMEYVEGTDLQRKIRDGFKATYRQALDLVTQGARGLAAAGEHGIVHRDIKPANMMITAKGVLKLMDFGLVKLVSSNEGMTMAGTIMGTVNYFSPEQGRGESCDQRTDIYALGVVFYELLTGKLPFTGADATSVIYQHIHTAPRKPKEIDPQIPEDYQAVVLKCLQKEPRDRYATADDLLADLENIAEGRKPQTAYTDPKSLRAGATILKSPPFAAEKSPNATRSRWPLYAAIVLVLAGGGLLVRRHVKQQQRDIVPRAVAAPEDETLRAQVGDPVAALGRARRLVADRLYDQARGLVDDQRRVRPDDQQWSELARDLDAREAEAAAEIAEKALDRGDDTAAETAVAKAESLAPQAPRTRTVAQRLAERVGRRRTRARGVEQVQSLLAEGQPERADEVVQQLASDFPEDPEIAGLAKRARKERDDAQARATAVREALDQGEQSLARLDLDAALLAFTAARQLDPKSARAADGLARVEQRKKAIAAVRTDFEAALAARDLAGAEKHLARLRSEAPGSAVLVIAENELANSRLIEEDAKKKESERVARAAAQAAEALAVIGDAKRPLADGQRAADDFARAWPDSAEVATLRRAVDDRTARDAVVAMLARLDAAVLAKDAATLTALVRDAEFSSRLAELMALDGLEYATIAGAFARDGESATIGVELRHALPTYPESILPATYRLRREQGAWVVVGADLSN
ncbi:MAG TPA: protein kinase [Planctomycetota bacterium]|nr:protein kinase [Planctomycetota bacterium]